MEELYQRYDVPRKIGQPWVEADQILPLLDGLDEVKPAHRAACVEAINAFRKAHDLPLVICSRTADYRALAIPLQLYGAIVVQPLSPQQVDSYLTAIGPAGEAVRRVMGHDPMLGEMLDSPLMLNIVTVAYAGQPESQPRLSGTLKEQRDHLFGAYVDQMFRRRGIVRRYTPQQTIHWLTWLAWQMVQRSQTVFYIERLQPDWLPGEKRWAFVLFYGLVFGLFGGLVFGLFGGLVFWLGIGLVGGLVIGLDSGILSEKIICVETVSWSWPKPKKKVLVDVLVNDLVFGLFGGLVFGLFGGLVFGLFGGLVIGLVVELVFWLVIGLVIGLFGGLSVGEIETRDIPNQGIHRSAWNALLIVLYGGLVFGLFGGLVIGLVRGLFIGLIFGLFGGQHAGGQACLMHLALRLWLVLDGSIPWNYVKFLDYAAERILLRKVGGGYIFIHRMLLEYFAARYDKSSVEATPNAEPSQIAIEM